MALYRPNSSTGVFLGLKGTTTKWGLMDEISGTAIDPTAPDTPPADPTMSLYAGTAAQRPTPGSAGTATYDLNPADALAALRDLRSIQGKTNRRTVREEQGQIRTAINATAARLAIATTGVATLSATGGADGVEDFDDDPDWQEGLVVVSGTNAYVIERFLTSTTMQVEPIGTVAANVVTLDDDATISAQVSAAIFTAVEYAVRRQFVATLNTLSKASSATERTQQVVFQLADFEVESYLLADTARTIPLPSVQ